MKYLLTLLILVMFPMISMADITKDLKQGMKNSDVFRLQAILIDEGYLNVSTASGAYNTQTVQAVKKYQKANNLIVTGTINVETRDRLNGVQKNANKVEAVPTTKVEPQVSAVIPVLQRSVSAGPIVTGVYPNQLTYRSGEQELHIYGSNLGNPYSPVSVQVNISPTPMTIKPLRYDQNDSNLVITIPTNITPNSKADMYGNIKYFYSISIGKYVAEIPVIKE